MKVWIKRSRTERGLIKKKAQFFLEVRAELTEEEQALIKRCDVGKATLYSWNVTWDPEIEFVVTPDGLVRGQTIDCGNFSHMLSAEEEVKEGCRALKQLLEKADKLDQEEVLEI